ncbi:MAG: GDP-L-fucose synthase [Candidatus Pacearchaeota archaeon]|jgi:GDP-L-fucose synthase
MGNSLERILVTGGDGFLGKKVVKNLVGKGYNVYAPKIEEYNLVHEEPVRKMFEENGPFNKTVHLAARVGGIDYNKNNPGTAFYENIMMNVLIQEYSRLNNVEKFLGIGSVCAYPKNTPVPFKEENLWKDKPEETNAPYGLAKKMMMVQSEAYRKQYGFNAIHLLMVNLYGPGDNFNPKNSHVIPATIKKIIDAKESRKEEIVMWGTGKASREFIYVEDAAEAIVLAMEKYDKPNPINIGSGMEITMKELSEKIISFTDYPGQVNWDITKPEGELRRCLDISKAEEEFGFRAKIGFDEGLKETIDWYLKNK